VDAVDVTGVVDIVITIGWSFVDDCGLGFQKVDVGL